MTNLPGRQEAFRVLVVEDERDIAALVSYHLTKEGYRVRTAETGQEALEAIGAERPDLVILDLMLPGRSGYEILAELRAKSEYTEIPVVVLTARREEAERVRGLELGADDYVTKPFSPRELVLRVSAVLRRSQAPAIAGATRILQGGPVTVDLNATLVTVGGLPLDLTPTEYKLLVTLIERRGRVQTRKQLLESAWETSADIETRTVDMHVQRLRTKLGTYGDLIDTVRGFGYRFQVRDNEQ